MLSRTIRSNGERQNTVPKRYIATSSAHFHVSVTGGSAHGFARIFGIIASWQSPSTRLRPRCRYFSTCFANLISSTLKGTVMTTISETYDDLLRQKKAFASLATQMPDGSP